MHNNICTSDSQFWILIASGFLELIHRKIWLNWYYDWGWDSTLPWEKETEEARIRLFIVHKHSTNVGWIVGRSWLGTGSSRTNVESFSSRDCEIHWKGQYHISNPYAWLSTRENSHSTMKLTRMNVWSCMGKATSHFPIPCNELRCLGLIFFCLLKNLTKDFQLWASSFDLIMQFGQSNPFKD